ncbi:hypothetical protein M9458_001530, partial [Cirrhinus mrigala]
PAANSAEGVVVESDPGERSTPLSAASSGAVTSGDISPGLAADLLLKIFSTV